MRLDYSLKMRRINYPKSVYDRAFLDSDNMYPYDSDKTELAIKSITPLYRNIIRLRYKRGMTLEASSKNLELSKESLIIAEKKAIQLFRNAYMMTLTDASKQLSLPLSSIGLSSRLITTLYRIDDNHHISSVGDLVKFIISSDDISQCPNLGETSLKHIFHNQCIIKYIPKNILSKYKKYVS